MAHSKIGAAEGLPKQIFVRWEGDDDAPFLAAEQTEADAADREERIIGVYELKEVHAVKLVTTTRTVVKRVTK